MGITEILTLCFIILKLIGVIDWSWWLVLLPELIAVGLFILFGGVILKIISKMFGRG